MGVNIVQAVKEYLFRAVFAFVKELDIFLCSVASISIGTLALIKSATKLRNHKEIRKKFNV